MGCGFKRGCPQKPSAPSGLPLAGSFRLAKPGTPSTALAESLSARLTSTDGASRPEQALSTRYAGAIALVAGHPCASGAEREETCGGHRPAPARATAHRVRADPVYLADFLPVSNLHSRAGAPGGGTGQGSCLRVPDLPRRHGLELLDGSAGTARSGTGERLGSNEINRRGCRHRPRP